jgi:phospholipase/carboxylesterase
MGDLAGVCQAIDTRKYLYALPNAPIPLQGSSGVVGYAWSDLPEGGNAEAAQNAVEMLAAFLGEVTDQYPVEHGQVALGGFSQGGMMTYMWGLPNPKLFLGLAVLSSRVPEPDVLLERLPAARTQRIFIAHGTADSMVSVKHGRESRQFLEAQGYSPEYREYQMGHEITQDVLADLVPWFHTALDPADGSA